MVFHYLRLKIVRLVLTIVEGNVLKYSGKRSGEPWKN
jgi:hypothetical protein